VIELITKNGQLWKPTQRQMRMWQELHPGINLKREFLKMESWLLNNPARRKTVRGMGRFVDNWLASARPEKQNSTRAQSLEEQLFDRSWAE
jgi:hypothetical protein